MVMHDFRELVDLCVRHVLVDQYEEVDDINLGWLGDAEATLAGSELAGIGDRYEFAHTSHRLRRGRREDRHHTQIFLRLAFLDCLAGDRVVGLHLVGDAKPIFDSCGASLAASH
jgi:hypothetical protein